MEFVFEEPKYTKKDLEEIIEFRQTILKEYQQALLLAQETEKNLTDELRGLKIYKCKVIDSGFNSYTMNEIIEILSKMIEINVSDIEKIEDWIKEGKYEKETKKPTRRKKA